MAHTKTGAAVKGNRDSQSKRLGVKRFGGEKVVSGNILIRQRGSKTRPGKGVKMGSDFTIYAIEQGKVFFHSLMGKKYVSVSAS